MDHSPCTQNKQIRDEHSASTERKARATETAIAIFEPINGPNPGWDGASSTSRRDDALWPSPTCPCSGWLGLMIALMTSFPPLLLA